MKDNALSSLSVFNEGKAGVMFGVFHRNSGEAFSPHYATWQHLRPHNLALQRCNAFSFQDTPLVVLI